MRDVKEYIKTKRPLENIIVKVIIFHQYTKIFIKNKLKYISIENRIIIKNTSNEKL
jgi:hypothetical protein